MHARAVHRMMIDVLKKRVAFEKEFDLVGDVDGVGDEGDDPWCEDIVGDVHAVGFRSGVG